MDALSSELLKQMYQCVGAPLLWPRLLDDLAARAGAFSILLQRVHRDGLYMRTRWSKADSRASTLGLPAVINDSTNPRMRTRLSPPRGEVAFFRDELAFDPADPVVRDLHRLEAALEFGHFLGARVEIGPGETLLVAMYRHSSAPSRFGEAEEAMLREVMPHLGQTVTLAGEMSGLRNWQRHIGSALDRLSLGIVICDVEGTVDHANEAAMSILASEKALRLAHGRIEAASSTDRQRLQRMARQALAGRRVGARLGDGGHAIDVTLLPCHQACDGSSGSDDEKVLLLVSPSAARFHIPADLLAEVHRLTPAEAALAAAICAGTSLQDYAAARGVSVYTARFQLKQVLAKTGSTRQSDLVRQVCSSAISSVGLRGLDQVRLI